MKKFLRLIAFLGMTLAFIPYSKGDINQLEGLYPLDIRVRVYPEEIRYGDVCFFTFSVTNGGPETLYLPYARVVLGGYLYLGGKQVPLNDRAWDHFEGGIMSLSSTAPLSFPGHPVKSGETMEFCVCLYWFPLPEFAHSGQSKKLLQLINEGVRDYTIQFSIFYREAYLGTKRPQFDENNRPLFRKDFPAEELSFRELETKGYKVANNDRGNDPVDKVELVIRILPRLPEEITLLQEWYLELPRTICYGHWYPEYIFAHPFHVRGSPYKMDINEMESLTKFEIGQKRDPFHEPYRKFFESMDTRTPESLARIERTNELAAHILERAKQPGSTISQNMVEFIQLRGFLVDIRYAENTEAEQAAFDRLVQFVENAKDKELWIKFLYETGFPSIREYQSPLHKKVAHYRRLFGERFAEEKVLPKILP